jgi:CheY-like chemotaxis protein
MGECAGLDPAARQGTVATWEDERNAAVNGAARILVVDDVAVNREILKRRLLRRGFEITEAGGGREALEIIDREAVDLVLLDIMMPDVDGLEVVRTVRLTRSTEELPIIMVSARSFSEDVTQCLELGANDYVTKPVDFEATLMLINRELARKGGCANAAIQPDGV